MTGADGLVLACRSPQVSVHDLGPFPDWAAGQARTAGYAGMPVACEPAGPGRMAVQDLCQERGLPFACVQPLVTHVAREQEDLTGDKADEGGCVLIARLARELHCYEPEHPEGARAELREGGRRRAQLITNAAAAGQLLRGMPGLAAPALLESACEPFEPATWLASLEVVLERCGGDLAKVTVTGFEAFAAAVRAALPGWGGQRAGGTCGQLPAALGDGRGVARMRRAALRRARGALADLKHARSRRARAGADMIVLPGEPGIDAARICQVPGLSPVTLAAILAGRANSPGHSPRDEQARLDVEDHLAGDPGQLPRPARGPSPARLNAAGTPGRLSYAERRSPGPRTRAVLAPRARPYQPRARASIPAKPATTTHQPCHLAKHPQNAAKALSSTSEITCRNRLATSSYAGLRGDERRRPRPVCGMRVRGHSA